MHCAAAVPPPHCRRSAAASPGGSLVATEVPSQCRAGRVVPSEVHCAAAPGGSLVAAVSRERASIGRCSLVAAVSRDRWPLIVLESEAAGGIGLKLEARGPSDPESALCAGRRTRLELKKSADSILLAIQVLFNDVSRFDLRIDFWNFKETICSSLIGGFCNCCEF
jgi:putative hemolysin